MICPYCHKEIQPNTRILIGEGQQVLHQDCYDAIQHAKALVSFREQFYYFPEELVQYFAGRVALRKFIGYPIIVICLHPDDNDGDSYEIEKFSNREELKKFLIETCNSFMTEIKFIYENGQPLYHKTVVEVTVSETPIE